MSWFSIMQMRPKDVRESLRVLMPCRECGETMCDRCMDLKTKVAEEDEE